MVDCSGYLWTIPPIKKSFNWKECLTIVLSGEYPIPVVARHTEHKTYVILPFVYLILALICDLAGTMRKLVVRIFIYNIYENSAL